MQVRYVTEQFLRFSEVHLQSMNYPRNLFIIPKNTNNIILYDTQFY